MKVEKCANYIQLGQKRSLSLTGGLLLCTLGSVGYHPRLPLVFGEAQYIYRTTNAKQTAEIQYYVSICWLDSDVTQTPGRTVFHNDICSSI